MQEVAVGALLDDGGVLLVHRRPDKRAYPGVWDLPGGHLEAGESVLGGLARELREELGVLIATDSASPLCRLVAGPAGMPAALSVWLVRSWTGTPANLAPDEHDDVRWFGLDRLPGLPHQRVRAALLGVR